MQMFKWPEPAADTRPITERGGFTAGFLVTLAGCFLATLALPLFVVHGEQVPQFLPAGGFALGAVVSFGRRVWPAIWIGVTLGYCAMSGADLIGNIGTGRLVVGLLLGGAFTLQSVLAHPELRNFLHGRKMLLPLVSIGLGLALTGLLTASIVPMVWMTLVAMSSGTGFLVLGFLNTWIGACLAGPVFAPLTVLAFVGTGLIVPQEQRRGTFVKLAIISVVTACIVIAITVMEGSISDNCSTNSSDRSVPCKGLYRGLSREVIWYFFLVIREAGLVIGVSMVALVLRVASMETALRQEIEQGFSNIAQMANFYASIFDDAVDGIYLVDYTRRRILAANKSAERMFGYEPGKMEGLDSRRVVDRDWIDMLHADNKSFRDFVKEKSGAPFDWVGLHKDGKRIFLEASSSCHIQNEREIWSVVFRDVSQRRREEELKRQFISMVTHELRTPLTSINGALGLLLSGKVVTIPVGAEKLLKIANDNSRRLLVIVNDILDIEKIAAGHMKVEMRLLDVARVLDQACAAIGGYAAQFSVSVKLDTPESIPQVALDPTRLMQVMDNLLSNAIKFSPRDGEVTVRAFVFGNFMRISVHNDGAGIPPEYQASIFEKFSQVPNTSPRQVKGTGLGLAMAKAMVNAMGGRISFESLPDQGATFFVDLSLGVS